ncbi:MAG: c-type cytochrome [Sandaracinaceae bacterium]|nr:c-type cytochrome [Sandaracinaceae bacterium]
MRIAPILCACVALAACTHVTVNVPSEPDAGPPWMPPPPVPDGGPIPSGRTTVSLMDVEPVAVRPSIAGGSLVITEAGLIVAGDPDGASLWVLDPEARSVRGRIALEPDDEPGRMVEDSDGRVHVVLRRSGGVLTVDPATASVVEARAVCRTPRGIAWDAGAELLWIACASGELLAMPPSRSPVTRVIRLDDDLRDVLVGEDRLYVSRFRSAELLDVDPTTGAVIARRQPPERTREIVMRPEVSMATTVPNTAWRIRLSDSGEVVMLHQTAISTPIEVEMSGYSGDGCGGGVVGPALSVFEPAGGSVRAGGNISNAVLAVDLAIARRADAYYFAAAATDALDMWFGMGVLSLRSSFLSEDCQFADMVSPSMRPTAVSAVGELADGRVVSVHVEPFRVIVADTVEFVAPARPLDRGYELFHTATPSLTACASCHPEGGEDGHVWDFVGTGVRRTQSLLGGLLETAPFHWAGDQPDMTAIMMGGFMQRMGGSSTPDEAILIGQWLDAQPLPERPATDAAAVERGRAVFEDASTSCASCHSGPALTDNASVDVGTGGDFQVPSLRGLVFRAPYFHDGCAESIEALVAGSCASSHTNTSDLDDAQRADLVAYLRSL